MNRLQQFCFLHHRYHPVLILPQNKRIMKESVSYFPAVPEKDKKKHRRKCSAVFLVETTELESVTSCV